MAELLKKDGTPRKKPGRKPAEVKEPPQAAKPVEETKPNEGFELPINDIREITVTSRKRVSLSDPDYDPANKFKTDPNMYYRWINTRPHLLRKREAEGYKPIPGSEYGDLVVAKLPKEVRKEREDYHREKTLRQTKAAVEQFKETAERAGVETFDEK